MALTSNQSKFNDSDNPDIVSSDAPSGNIGITNTSGHNGFFVYSEKPYTLWFKDSLGAWAVHQTFASENLVNATSFQWGVNQAAYFQTSESPHDIYVYGRQGALLIDSTPSDENNVLAAYYKFENNADDSGVSSLNGTESAGCAFVAGKSGMGQALHQTTAADSVALPHDDLANLGSDFTIAAWVYIPSVQSATLH